MGEKMQLKIAKWGNGLALRIPADYVRHMDIKEGDTMQASLTVDGGMSIRPAKWNRKVFAAELENSRAAMAMGTSVIEALRQGARY